jgi:hypothetical protein
VRGALGSCTDAAGIAWLELQQDGTGARLRCEFPSACCGPASGTELALVAAGASRRVGMLAADLDADGRDEIVLQWQDGRVDVIRAPADASNIAVAATNRFDDRFAAPPAVADVDANGTLEILALGSLAMHVLSLSTAEQFGWPYTFAVDPRLGVETDAGTGAGTPLAADLDGDGRLEVLAVLPGGALLVWDASGVRRPWLEVALPAVARTSAVLQPAAAPPGLEIAALGQAMHVQDWVAETESLVTVVSAQVVRWRWPAAGSAAWTELGGGPGHGFRVAGAGEPVVSANDPGLPTFTLGPNPAAGEARARVELTSPAQVECAVYNLEGELVQRAGRAGGAGEIVEFAFDLNGMASGVYLVRMQVSPGGVRVRPLAVAR